MKKNITVEELVKMELEYIEKQKYVPYIINEFEGLVPANHNDVLFFFMQKHINMQYQNLTNEVKHDLSKWQLTKFEMLMLLCYLGDLSDIFDSGDSRFSPYPINEMCKALDSLLIKAPKCHDIQIVYRQCRRRDNVDEMKEGGVKVYSYYLTTSVKNLNQDNHQLVIKVNKNNTNGRSLYKLRDKLGEKQITFKRNTSFLIVKIEPFFTDNGEYKRIYMEEV